MLVLYEYRHTKDRNNQPANKVSQICPRITSGEFISSREDTLLIRRQRERTTAYLTGPFICGYEKRGWITNFSPCTAAVLGKQIQESKNQVFGTTNMNCFFVEQLGE
jgi:hypothetical protein